MALTGKQQRFVQEYLVDLNAKEAAKRAGYSPKSAHAQGHRLVNEPEIREAIEAGRADRSERTRLNADWVIAQLQAVYSKAMEASEEDKPNLAAANKALELLGRHTGAYEPHVSLDLPAVQQAEDAVSAMSAVLSAVASGQITPSQGQTVGSLIETCRRTIETEDLARRLENLEQQTGSNA